MATAITEHSTTDLKRILFLLAAEVPISAWDCLDNREKEILADVVDETGRRLDTQEGIDPGDELAYTPEPRWWREDEEEHSGQVAA